MASTEKTKHRMDTELEDLQLEFERVNAAAIVADKRAQNFDKVDMCLAADDADYDAYDGADAALADSADGADDADAALADADSADGADSITCSNTHAGDW